MRFLKNKINKNLNRANNEEISSSNEANSLFYVKQELIN